MIRRIGLRYSNFVDVDQIYQDDDGTRYKRIKDKLYLDGEPAYKLSDDKQYWEPVQKNSLIEFEIEMEI